MPFLNHKLQAINRVPKLKAVFDCVIISLQNVFNIFTKEMQDTILKKNVKVFAVDGFKAEPAATGALLCGMKGMAEEVTAALTAAGVDEDRVLTNF